MERQREILPIPDKAYAGFIAYDAKDPDSKFAAIEPLRPAEGAPNVLVEAVHVVARGKKYISADVAQSLALRNVTTAAGAADGLSAREFEILRMLVQGNSVRDIALSLGLNPKTVANHQSAIKQKLGAETAVQLLRIAGTFGLHPKQPD